MFVFPATVRGCVCCGCLQEHQDPMGTLMKAYRLHISYLDDDDDDDDDDGKKRARKQKRREQRKKCESKEKSGFHLT